MTIETSHVDGVAVIEPLVERLDHDNAGVLRARLLDLAAAGERAIVVDLGRVAFLDSSALGAVLSGLKALGPEGRLSLCALSPRVRHVIELTRLDRIVRLFETREAAIAGERVGDGGPDEGSVA
jgi:anti-sigma B factor antagonist